MNILVVCEESQVVTKAFRAKGHNAFSCDLQMCSGGLPEFHIMGDALKIINGFTSFVTCDGLLHNDVVNKSWDLLICHPPCTYLSKAGSCNLFDFYGNIKNYERYLLGLAAREFFYNCLNAHCDKICVENPVPIGIFKLPRYQQIIEPYYFGDPYTKRTLLWLKGLPVLETKYNLSDFQSVSSWCELHSSSKVRSRTFPGIASAMADQWNESSKPFQISIFDYFERS